MDKISILLMDKREIFREGLANILHRAPNIKVVCKCSKGLEAVEKARELEPNIIVLDTEMPNCQCTRVIRRIYQLLPNSRIIILTHSEEDDQLFSTIKAGAAGYLSKDISVEELIQSIGLVAKGDVIISPPMTAEVLREFALLEKVAKEKQGVGLTDREKQVLTLVARGATNREIAAALFITENTVKAHLHKIMEKLHVRNRLQAAALATGKRLLS